MPETKRAGFARVAVAVPDQVVANADENSARTLALMTRAHDQGIALVVFPELNLSSYTARDLFLDEHLLDQVEVGLASLLASSRDLDPLFVVGAPLRDRGLIYNCAVAFQGGELLGVVPKMYLPNYREFEERRWFRPGTEVAAGSTVVVCDREVPFGGDLLFAAKNHPDLVVGLEICEDIWVQSPPSMNLCSQGATVIANLSASNFTIGKAELRRLLCRSASDRAKCAYLYVAAGPGESSTDLAFDADAFIVENGAILKESERFLRAPQLVAVDVDVEMLLHERRATNTFGDCAHENRKSAPRARSIPFTAPERSGGLVRDVAAHPFLPRDEATLAERCWEIFEIQCNALLTRMRAIGQPKLVLGVSGGLDSTQAALVAAAALDLDGRPRTDLICATMPGFGTTTATRSNAQDLAEHLGATFLEIPISEAAHSVLRSTEHAAAMGTAGVEELLENLKADPDLGDPTLENAQARVRTLMLMTLANQHGGIVVGTGDLSEKALGWATYAGDHIAMYDVNAGVPKTLIRFVISWVASARLSTWSLGDPEKLKSTLEAIIDTPISPELLPPDAEGKIAQLTEDKIGPYELHDFFLFHVVRHGRPPTRVLEMAEHAFAPRYDTAALKKWLRTFYWRFFSNQFKRSCATDAPKVGMVALSPRGDWRMPSDAKVASWLDEVEAYKVSST